MIDYSRPETLTGKIIWGDCLPILKRLPDKSIDLVVTDPPYFRVVDADWDRQWDSITKYINWIEPIIIEFKRVLKDNGSLYIFCDDRNSAYLQVMIDRHMIFLNHLVWYKTNNRTIKGIFNLRSFATMTERVLFYTNENSRTGLQSIHNSSDCFQSVKAYMRDERKKCMDENGFNTIEDFNIYIREVTNTSSVVDRHYFADSQYCFPTEELYKKLQSTGFWARDYEDLRRDYEDLRRDYEDLRRVFNPSMDTIDVFMDGIITNGENTEHPTTKPVKIMKRLIRASSNEGDLILDPFSGSGTTAVACHELNRKWIMVERELRYVGLARRRLDGVIAQGNLFRGNQ